jgi:hypothetical protein
VPRGSSAASRRAAGTTCSTCRCTSARYMRCGFRED